MMLIIVSILLSFVGLVTAQNYTGCVDPNDPTALVRIGEKTTICLQIGNSLDWKSGVDYTRASFQPEADTYSRFHLSGSYSDLLVGNSGTIWDGKNISVGVASQNGLSFLRTYYNINTQRIFPYLTAIIEVNQGVVQGITWDDACVFCGGGECDEITYDFNGNLQTQQSSGQPTRGCSFDQEKECNVFLSNSDTRCDVILYVVWTGSDGNGKAFQSSASRFSQFPAQELQDRLTRNLPQIPTFGFGDL